VCLQRNQGATNINMKGQSQIVPPVIGKVVDRLLCKSIADLQEVTRPCIQSTLQWCIEAYNGEAKRVNDIVFQHNTALLKQFEENGDFTVDDLRRSAWQYQEQIDDSTIAWHHQVKSFMKNFAVNSYTQSSRPGAHLPYESEPMKRYRNFINNATVEHGVHPQLILYWDQVWVLLFSPESRILWKSPTKQGPQEA